MICLQLQTLNPNLFCMLVMQLSLMHIQSWYIYKILQTMSLRPKQMVQSQQTGTNFQKSNYRIFVTNNNMCLTSNSGFHNKSITLLGLQSVDNFNWMNHSNILKMSSACSARRKVTPLMTTDTSNLVQFAPFQSVLSSRLLFWGNSTGSY
jgi:hypothetical protein